MDYCRAYPNAVLPDPDDCSRYYDCNRVTATGSKYFQCTYPDLFSPADNKCVPFSQVQCGTRKEPTSPCKKMFLSALYNIDCVLVMIS